MKKLFIATRNAHKLREMKQILAGADFDVRGLDGLKGYVEPEETGATFIENARIKARALKSFVEEKGRLHGIAPTETFVIADDSGLECSDLWGLPGVKSARFAGAGHSTQDNNAKLVQMFRSLTNPTYAARYVCAMVLMRPDGTAQEIVKTCEGQITLKPRGANGFGYDPYFYLPQYGCTMAELSPEEKNKISHRGKALRAVAGCIKAPK